MPAQNGFKFTPSPPPAALLAPTHPPAPSMGPGLATIAAANWSVELAPHIASPIWVGGRAGVGHSEGAAAAAGKGKVHTHTHRRAGRRRRAPPPPPPPPPPALTSAMWAARLWKTPVKELAGQPGSPTTATYKVAARKAAVSWGGGRVVRGPGWAGRWEGTPTRCPPAVGVEQQPLRAGSARSLLRAPELLPPVPPARRSLHGPLHQTPAPASRRCPAQRRRGPPPPGEGRAWRQGPPAPPGLATAWRQQLGTRCTAGQPGWRQPGGPAALRRGGATWLAGAWLRFFSAGARMGALEH